MAGYKEIKGFQVQTRSEDPSPTEVQVGDFYYNSSTGQFKTINDGGAPIGSWASGGNLNTARYVGGSGGNVNSAIMAGGNTGGPYTNASESYDGSSWTATPALNTGRGFMASATQSPATAAIVFSGYDGPPTSSNNTETERWDGSSWTEVADLNTGRRMIGGAGATYDAVLGFGGKTSPSGAQTITESWNGSAWTEVADLNTARWEGPGGFGTSTAAFAIGGYIPPGSYGAVVESWNGSSWTETTDLNTARAQMASTGLTTAGIVAGGFSPPTTAKTESWNGSSWTEVNDMSTARYGPGYGTGTGPTNLLFSGGYTTTDVANTEEWTAADFQIKTVTTS